jgi:hypothetical protein
MLNSREPAGKLENKSRAGTATKRGRNKRRKLFSESLRRKRTPNKAEEFYAAGIRPKVQRGLHRVEKLNRPVGIRDRVQHGPIHQIGGSV